MTTPAKLATFALALLLTGCAATPTSDAGAGINRASGRIAARAEGIGEQAAQIESAPIGTPIESVKPLATSIRTQAGWIGVDVTEVDKHVTTLENTILQQRIDYHRLESKWYVTWGRRAEWLLLAVAIANVVNIILPIAFPGWGLIASKWLTRLVPVVVSSPIRDWFLRKAAK